MLGNALFIRAHCLTGLRLAKTFLHLCPCVFVCVRLTVCVCAHVLAGGLHRFMIVLNCVSVRCVFIVTHMWLSHLFLHPRLLLHHTSLLYPSPCSVHFVPTHGFFTVDWCDCGRAHHVRCQFTLSESMRLREQVHISSVESVRCHVEIWSRAHLCFSVICVAERELPQTLI